MTAETGVDRIKAERLRQINDENYTSEHDADHHARGELAMAAACYVLLAGRQHLNKGAYSNAFARELFPWSPSNGLYWPFDRDSWKPSDDPVRNLEKAGALIAAEIDRLTS